THDCDHRRAGGEPDDEPPSARLIEGAGRIEVHSAGTGAALRGFTQSGRYCWLQRRAIGGGHAVRKKLDHEALATLVRALVFASRKHSQQRRKDADASPYINHPIALVSILAVEAGVADIGTLCAALLHDTIEDTNTAMEE